VEQFLPTSFHFCYLISLRSNDREATISPCFRVCVEYTLCDGCFGLKSNDDTLVVVCAFHKSLFFACVYLALVLVVVVGWVERLHQSDPSAACATTSGAGGSETHQLTATMAVDKGSTMPAGVHQQRPPRRRTTATKTVTTTAMTEKTKDEVYCTDLSARYLFEVGPTVHPASWGTKKHSNSCSSASAISKSKHAAAAFGTTKWSANDFTVIDKIGSGYFGKIYLAQYVRTDECNRDNRNNRTTTAAATSATDLHRIAVVLGKDDRIVLKVLSKRTLWEGQRSGRRSLELLLRETSIQS
jgi:hypothetical protein